MTSTASWRRHRPKPAEIASLAFIAFLIVAYFGLLALLDGRAKTYFENLRESDPQLYLTQLREARGFDAYLAEYRTMENFGEFRNNAPSFLVGRWTMRAEPLRLTPGATPTECSDPITFDYGLLLLRDGGGITLPVKYRIFDRHVELRGGADDILPVALINYGAQLDHIEFRPPGRTDLVYAYRCGQ